MEDFPWANTRQLFPTSRKDLTALPDVTLPAVNDVTFTATELSVWETDLEDGDVQPAGARRCWLDVCLVGLAVGRLVIAVFVVVVVVVVVVVAACLGRGLRGYCP